MNIKNRTAIQALLIYMLSTLSSSALAQGGIIDYIDGWGIGLSVGQVAIADTDGFFKISPDPDTGEGEVREFGLSSDDSTAPEVYVAFDFGNIRWLVEYASHSHDSENVTVMDNSGFAGSQQVVKSFDASMDVDKLFIIGSYRFRELEVAGASPFMGVGFGGAEFEVDGESDSSTMGLIQVGIEYPVSEAIAIEAKIRATKSFHDPKFKFDEGEWRTEYSSRSFHFGATYNF